VPPHLQAALVHWLQGAFGYRTPKQSGVTSRGLRVTTGGLETDLMLSVATAARLPVSPGLLEASKLQNEVISICLANEEAFLDTIDATLSLTYKRSVDALEKALTMGDSAWRVSADSKSLQRRVEPTAQQAADAAMQPNDSASEELRAAWTAAYSRTPDASDAWDHSIKAAEAVLIPVVVPKVSKATLGTVLGQLDKQGHLYKFVLPGRDDAHEISALIEMLKYLWPNPDRHASGNSRPPTLREAQAVTHLAVTIVQWIRDGALTRR
jgi:hypothetical protein